MSTTIIRNAQVIDPSQGIVGKYDVAIRDGKIDEVARSIAAGEGCQLIEAKGLTATAGFVDLHSHLREPGSETAESIESGTRAAAAGGFTTILAMANTNPVCDSETGVHYVLSRAHAVGVVNVLPVASVTLGQKGEELTNFGKLLQAGAVCFSDSFHSLMNAEIMRRALEYTKMLGVPILEHCEDSNLSAGGVMNEGLMSIRLGLKGIPRVAESTMVARNVALAEHSGGHVHISHVSARESVEAIRQGKRNGVRVTAEVTPHHLTMTEEMVAGYNTMAKMKPPLRSEEDRQALIAGLEDGTIDCIVTDHAPHSGTAKESVFDAAPFGVIGFESAFALLYTRFVASGRWSLDFLIEKLTLGPASIINRPLGTLARGAAADIVLLQTGTPFVFGRQHLRSKSANCPWLGEQFTGRVAATLVGGKVAFQNDEVFPFGLDLGPNSVAASRQAEKPKAAPTKKTKSGAKKKKKKKGRAGPVKMSY
ncbi:amidohydrolase family protein, partial [bacterium]|nr:amidohydrolase family protein [bacterium]